MHLFKNSLFLKIIFVFLFPSLGMLYFNSSLVYDKIKVLNESDKIQNNIKYIKDIEQLVHSLQKERGLSVSYLSSRKFKDKLYTQRIISNEKYKKLLKNTFSNEVVSINSIKHLQTKFHHLEEFRGDIDKFSTTSLKLIKIYGLMNESLLDMIEQSSKMKLRIEFDNKLPYINNLLVAKEKAGVERAATIFVLSKDEESNKVIDLLEKNYIIEEINIKHFLLNATLDEAEFYKSTIKQSLENSIKKIRKNLHSNDVDEIINIESWWELSTSRIDALEKVYEYVSQKSFNESKRIETDAYLSEILSFIFLIITVSMIIILLFLLRQIILTEQKSILKIKKQQNIYRLLNSTNHLLIKTPEEEELFEKTCELISLDGNTSFSIIYKKNTDNNFELAYERNHTKVIFKNQVLLFDEVLKSNDNLILNDLKKYNDAFHLDLVKKFNLESMIILPIKKFDEITEMLVIFSIEKDFFDKEIEILFDNMIHNIEHALEKIDYENDRKIKEDEIRIISYAFETNEPMLITDEKAVIINANEAFCNVMGYKKENIIGKNPSIFKSKYHEKDFYENMWKSINDTGSWSGELYNTVKSRQIMPLLSTITAVKDDKGIVKHYLAQYINISEQKDKQKILEYHATHDHLTDLPNRLLLLDRIEHAIQKVVRHNIVGSLIFIDLDNFKKVNDTLGHEVGDKLLIEVSKTLKRSVRNEDTVSRIGGDEFIILSDCIGDTKEEARINIINLAKKIKLNLNSIEKIDGHKNIVTPSIGVTLFSDDSLDVNDIIKQADTAMYEAKKQGKNSIELFS